MLVSELRHAIRNLVRAPRFSLACVVTLALAVAGTMTLLNLLETFVFRKLSLPAPEQRVGIYPARNETSAGFSLPALHALPARQQALTEVCGFTAGYGALNVQTGSRRYGNSAFSFSTHSSQLTRSHQLTADSR